MIAAQLLFNLFDYTWQNITVSLKFKLSGNLSLKSVNYFVMKYAKPKLIDVKYVNWSGNSFMVRITIISNVYSCWSLAVY